MGSCFQRGAQPQDGGPHPGLRSASHDCPGNLPSPQPFTDSWLAHLLSASLTLPLTCEQVRTLTQCSRKETEADKVEVTESDNCRDRACTRLSLSPAILATALLWDKFHTALVLCHPSHPTVDPLFIHYFPWSCASLHWAPSFCQTLSSALETPKQIKQPVISSIGFTKGVPLSSVQGDKHCDIRENCVQREQREGSDFLELSGKA